MSSMNVFVKRYWPIEASWCDDDADALVLVPDIELGAKQMLFIGCVNEWVPENCDDGIMMYHGAWHGMCPPRPKCLGCV